MKLELKNSEGIAGFLDEGAKVKGELHFAGTLRIDGNFCGTIVTEGILIIGEKAFVQGDIKAGEIEISGRICGNVEAKRRAQIHPTGRLCGDITTPELVMTPGALLDGRSSMTAVLA